MTRSKAGTMVCVLALATAATTGTPPGKEAAMKAPTTALLVIDIQNFYFEGGSLPLTGPVEAAKQARRVLDRFRERRPPRTCGSASRRSPAS